MYIRQLYNSENCSESVEYVVGESVQRVSGSGVISHYLNNNPYTDHIAETFVLLLLCILLLIYKIVDIFRKIIKCQHNDHVVNAVEADAIEPNATPAMEDDYMELHYADNGADYVQLDYQQCRIGAMPSASVSGGQ